MSQGSARRRVTLRVAASAPRPACPSSSSSSGLSKFHTRVTLASGHFERATSTFLFHVCFLCHSSPRGRPFRRRLTVSLSVCHRQLPTGKSKTTLTFSQSQPDPTKGCAGRQATGERREATRDRRKGTDADPFSSCLSSPSLLSPLSLLSPRRHGDRDRGPTALFSGTDRGSKRATRRAPTQPNATRRNATQRIWTTGRARVKERCRRSGDGADLSGRHTCKERRCNADGAGAGRTDGRSPLGDPPVGPDPAGSPASLFRSACGPGFLRDSLDAPAPAKRGAVTQNDARVEAAEIRVGLF